MRALSEGQGFPSPEGRRRPGVRIALFGLGGLLLGAGVYLVVHLRERAERHAEVGRLLAEADDLLDRDRGSTPGGRDLRSKALATARSALDLDREASRAWRAIGVVHYRNLDFRRALDAYEKALVESAPAAWFREAGHAALHLYGEGGDRSAFLEAARRYEEAIERDPSDTEALFFAGRLHHEAGDAARRDEYWRRLVEVAPGSESAGLAREVWAAEGKSGGGV